MNLTNDRIKAMDGPMLISILNMKLRNEFSSLNELVRAFDLDTDLLQKVLQDLGYVYRADANQLRRG